MAVEKVTFTLPKELVQRLGEVPAGKRSMLVKDALERELARQAAVSTLALQKGATTDVGVQQYRSS